MAAGLCPDPLGELKRSPDSLAAIRGPTSKGGEGREGEGEGGEGEEREGKGRERNGKGGQRRGMEGEGSSLVQF